MEIRPLEPLHDEAVHAVATRRDVACWHAATPYVERPVWTERLADGGDAWLWFGAFDGEALRGYLHFRFVARRRAIHIANLELGGDEAALDVLAAEAARLADDWLGVTRLEAQYEAASPQGQALARAGFAVEATRRWATFRGGAPRDVVIYGRLKPGWSPPRPSAPMVPPPRPTERATVKLRPLRQSDAEAAAAYHRHPSVLGGTLLTPGMTGTRWRAFSANLHRIGAEVDGQLVGQLALKPLAHVGVYGLGMAVDSRYHGRGVGGVLLDAAIELADGWLGARRIDLEVWTDNPRAEGLYRSRGFRPEGSRPASGIRDGGYVDSLVMGRVPGLDGGVDGGG